MFFSNILILIKTGATYPKVFSSLKKLFLNIYRKKLVLESHLKKVAEYVRNFIKKTLRGKCFAVNFAKIFRTSFFMEHLRVTSSEKNNIVHKIRFIEFLQFQQLEFKYRYYLYDLNERFLNPLLLNVVMVRHTLKILQQMLQDFLKCVWPFYDIAK